MTINKLRITVSISSQKQQELPLSKEMISLIMEYSTDGIIILQDNRIIFCNKQLERITKFDRTELSSKCIEDLFHPEDQKTVSDSFGKVLNDGDKPDFCEGRIFTKDGNIKNLLLKNFNIPYNSDSAVLAILSVQDEDDKEIKSFGNEQTYRELYESALVGLFRTRLSDGKLMWCNNKFAEIFGAEDKDRFVGKVVSTDYYIDPAQREQITADLKKTGKAENLEIKFKKLDGSIFWTKSSTWLNPTAEYIEGFMIDTTKEKHIEQSIKKNEDKYRSLFENLDDVLYLADMTGKVTLISPSVEKAAGFNPQEVIGKNIDSFYADPSMRKTFLSMMERDGYVRGFETTLKCKDGSVAWVSVNAHYLRDANGNIVGIEGLCRDINKQKWMEQALAESEAKYKQLVEGLNEGLCSLDTFGEITYANRRMSGLLGYSAKEILDKPLRSLITPEGQDEFDRLLGRVKHGIGGQCDLEFLRKDGRRIYANLGISPIFDSDGSYSGMIAGVMDITERKQAEFELQENEARQRLLLASISSPVIAMKEDLTVLYSNEAFAELIFTPYKELEGSNLREICPDFAESETFRSYLKVIESGKVEEVEEKLEDWYLHSRIYPTPWGVLAIAEDITERKKAEEALVKSEEEYRYLFENLQDIFYRVDNNENILMFSPSVERITGYKPEELIGRSLHTFVYNIPGNREKFLDEMMRNGRVEEFETEFKRKDGSTWHGSINAQLYKDRQGNVLGIEGMVRDISKRKKAEAELRKSEEKYRSFLENLADGCYVLDSELRYTFVNDAACNMIGKTKEEILNAKITDLFPGFAQSGFYRLYKNCLENQRNGILEDSYRTDDGRTGFYNVRVSIVPEGILVVARDITDRKKAEEALRESEQRFRGAFEYSATGMALVGTDGRLFKVNNRLCDMLGYTQDELLGKNFVDISYPDDIEVALTHFNRMIDGEIHSAQFECRYLHRNDDIVWCIISNSVAHYSNGKSKYLISQVLDITEQKNAERIIRDANQRLEREGELLEKKNVAFNMILSHIEQEKYEVRKQIASSIDRILVPTLRNLVNEDGSLNQTCYDVLLEGLLDITNKIGGTQYLYSRLSKREVLVCNLIKQGKPSKIIADELGITIKTVQRHRQTIRKKLGITNTAVNLTTFLRKFERQPELLTDESLTADLKNISQLHQ
ncbi:MAG: PAS domain S-box protein [candidate division Zixibacteria bacterium]|nr:PAS domain S-box protein [candidate division Zixibacteria bacterium]